MKRREPAVAGLFYPAEAGALQRELQRVWAAARPVPALEPKALIVPHAGYVYSGPVAASAYRLLGPLRCRIARVVLLGPAHRVALRGLAAPVAEAFRTPLGDVLVDRAALEQILRLPQVQRLEAAHADEHSLEVQLPFLQHVLERFSLVPLVVGEASAEEIAQVLDTLWGGDETLIVISSDLSHYHDYETARRLDAATSAAIEALDARGVGEESACGGAGIRGLLLSARRHRLQVRTLDLRSSGDTAGRREEVVGYGAYALA